MPKSRGRIKNKKFRAKNIQNGNKIVFRSMNFSPENREELKAAIIASARADVDNFQNYIKDLFGILKERMPEGVLSTFSFYGARAAVTDSGEMKSITKDIQQHHIELLQGIILTIPQAEWGTGPSTADIMQIAFDTVPKVADTFFKRRLIERTDESDPNKQAMLSLQEKIRLRTQAVRNWGYFGEVLKICREVYTPLDAKLLASTGYTFSDVLDVAETLVAESERKGNLHFDIMRKVFTAKTAKAIVDAYWREMPDLQGSAEDFYKIVPPGTSREGVMGALMSHADLRHVEIMAHKVDEISALTGKEGSIVEEILNTISITPGELRDQKIEHLFLANPVWARPGINLGNGHFLFAIPQAIFSHINEIMWNLAVNAKIDSDLSNRRASYLEDKTEAVLKSVLPTAQIQKNAKWSVRGEQFESDIIALVDKTLFLAEAKSHRLTPQGLRGAPDRLKRHLGDMVVAPSIQSERLANHIIAARAGEAESVAVVKSLGLDAMHIDQIIRVSITLDDLSVLSSSEEELRDAGLIPEDHSLAPSLHIADLCCIADILDHEILFLHYFSERFHFQKLFEIFGDELDFLGMYLSTGFNLGAGDGELRRLMLTGLSDVIDRYYNGKDAGLSLKKPKAQVHRPFKEIIDRLTERKPDGWTSIGLHLLNSASPDEQKRVERGLLRLRDLVKKKKKKPGEDCFMQITPALDRKAVVGFFVHRQDESSNRRVNMEHLAGGILEVDGATRCVIFAKNADNWSAPYEAVLYVQKQGVAQPELKS